MNKVQDDDQQNNTGATATSKMVEEEEVQLYAGAWTTEEMEYATALINDFRDGIIEGLHDKATMRNFLAKKLGCLTKRISKKFEKSGYNGRLQYQASGISGEAEEVKRRRMQLKDLENKFRESRKAILRSRGQQSSSHSTSSDPFMKRGFSSSSCRTTKTSGRDQSRHLLPQDQGSSIIMRKATTLNNLASPGGLVSAADLPASLRGNPRTLQQQMSDFKSFNLLPTTTALPPSVVADGVNPPGIAKNVVWVGGMLQQSSMMERDIIAASSSALGMKNLPNFGISNFVEQGAKSIPLARNYLGLMPVVAPTMQGYPTLTPATLLAGSGSDHAGVAVGAVGAGAGAGATADPTSTSLLQGLRLLHHRQAVTHRPLLQSNLLPLYRQQQQQQQLVAEKLMVQRKRELVPHDHNIYNEALLAQSAATNKRPRKVEQLP